MDKNNSGHKCPMQHFVAIGDSGRPRPVTRADFKDTIKDLKHGEFRTRISYAGGVPLRTLVILERPIVLHQLVDTELRRLASHRRNIA